MTTPPVDAKSVTPSITWGVVLRLSLASALAFGMLLWPYAARCGVGLMSYLGAVAVLIISGVWSAIWTFRHQAPSAHVLSLVLICWGLVLGALEVLPRIGYAKPTPAHPSYWACRELR